MYDDPVDATSVEEVFPADYLFPWEKEYHVSANIMRKIIDSIEDLGITDREAVYTIRKSDLTRHLRNTIKGVADQNIFLFLSKISLPARSIWDQDKNSLPNDMHLQDWYPWNFRRRLSLVSKPIVQLDRSEDPLLVISPGCIRKCVWYLLSNSLDAKLDERHFYSNEMKKWIGERRNQLGIDFNRTVAQKIIDLGWEAENDILVTRLLNCKTKVNYRDIDVLAWSKKLRVVVAADCIDLYFAKHIKRLGTK
ncbi:MAG: hypothetical protein SWO11_22160 [Thermodesulfobacteriota bacterium]|nr:hypothetical protein [Thermodesulfobacteriota bacterium]